MDVGHKSSLHHELRDISISGILKPFLDLGWSDDAKAALAAALTTRHCSHNEVIYLQEDKAEYLYIVVSGHVRLSYVMEDGSAILYALLPPAQTFGELGILDGRTNCDMAMGAGHTVIAMISAKKFHSLCARFPELRDFIAHLVARRYRSYIELTRIMSFKRLNVRIALALLRLADGLNSCRRFNGREVLCVGSVVTQADIGLMARGSRGNVNRALKAWERRGWLVIRDRTILIVNRTALEALALEEDA
jgi:CRP/FNR family transcriptional regulator, cyclic AMP receptor protein